jgi:hypothetical protein
MPNKRVTKMSKINQGVKLKAHNKLNRAIPLVNTQTISSRLSKPIHIAALATVRDKNNGESETVRGSMIKTVFDQQFHLA